MCVLVLIATIAALLTVLDGHEGMAVITIVAIAGLTIWSILLAAPAFVRSRR